MVDILLERSYNRIQVIAAFEYLSYQKWRHKNTTNEK